MAKRKILNSANMATAYADQARASGMADKDLKTLFRDCDHIASKKHKKSPAKSGNTIKSLAATVLSDMKTGRCNLDALTSIFTAQGVDAIAAHWDTDTQKLYLNSKSGAEFSHFALLDECIHQQHHADILDVFPHSKSVDDLHLNGMLDPDLVPTVAHMGVEVIITKDVRCKDENDVCWVATKLRYPADIDDAQTTPHVIALDVKGEDVGAYLKQHKHIIADFLANDDPCGYLMIDESGAAMATPPLAVDLRNYDMLPSSSRVEEEETRLGYCRDLELS